MKVHTNFSNAHTHTHNLGETEFRELSSAEADLLRAACDIRYAPPQVRRAAATAAKQPPTAVTHPVLKAYNWYSLRLVC